jgi:hypothetical protein
MSMITVGKWCGYCGQWVEDRGTGHDGRNVFIVHVDMCEIRRCDEIRKMKKENNDAK